MILRADYLQNRYARVLANRQILKGIEKELSSHGAERDAILVRNLERNYHELKAVKLAMKKINLKPTAK
jgi:hypothetical protein